MGFQASSYIEETIAAGRDARTDRPWPGDLGDVLGGKLDVEIASGGHVVWKMARCEFA